MSNASNRTIMNITRFMGQFRNVRLSVDWNRYIYEIEGGATLVFTDRKDGSYDVYFHGPKPSVAWLQEQYSGYFASQRVFEDL